MNYTRYGVLPIMILLLLPPAFGGEEPDLGKLISQASEAYDAGRFEACGRIYSQAIEQGARFETVPYNAACCYALAGNVERAFELLNLSLERGWREVSHLEADTDLARAPRRRALADDRQEGDRGQGGVREFDEPRSFSSCTRRIRVTARARSTGRRSSPRDEARLRARQGDRGGGRGRDGGRLLPRGHGPATRTRARGLQAGPRAGPESRRAGPRALVGPLAGCRGQGPLPAEHRRSRRSTGPSSARSTGSGPWIRSTSRPSPTRSELDGASHRWRRRRSAR